MDTRENRRADHRKQRHRLRGTIDRRAPFLTEQKQNRGDKRAGVSDTDPENEIGNVPGPAHRALISPSPTSSGNLLPNAKNSKAADTAITVEAHHPQPRAG